MFLVVISIPMSSMRSIDEQSYRRKILPFSFYGKKTKKQTNVNMKISSGYEKNLVDEKFCTIHHETNLKLENKQRTA